MKQLQRLIFTVALSFPLTLHASFIESTQGTAVVNDATATFYNPAALTLLKKPQFVTLESFSSSHSQFSGQFFQPRTGFVQSGSSHSEAHYFLPSIYLAFPTTDKIRLGLAVISNFLNRDVGDNSILRYSESSSSIQNVDVVPAFAVKLNDYLAFGAGINFSYAHFLLRPISGFPGLNIPDSESRNDTKARSVGGDAGILVTPNPRTLIGFNYRSAISYPLKGTSLFEGNPSLISNNYSFTFWTPARTIFSINHFVNKKLGFVGTVQRIQWSIFRNLNIHGIATQVGPRSQIINATVPQHLRNTWLFTLGTIYNFTPQWIVRIAGTYNQSAGNPHYQIANGDSLALGGSMSYEFFKRIILDGSYAHVFIQNEKIHIMNNRNTISGTNRGSLDVFSVKLAYNL